MTDYLIILRAVAKKAVQRDIVKNIMDKLKWMPPNVNIIQNKSGKGQERNTNQINEQKRNNKMVDLKANISLITLNANSLNISVENTEMIRMD